MSREDWDVYKQLRKERKDARAERREAWFKLVESGQAGEGWVGKHETHWQRQVLGDVLDYWPGPMKFRWRGKTMTGDVLRFIRNAEAK